MLTRHLLTRRADLDGVDVRVVERDYVLAHVVSQLHLAKPADGGRLVFKGGTALRFVHIAHYRYSADLDFTVVDGSVDAAIPALSTAVEAAKVHAGLPHLDVVPGNPATLAYIGPLGANEPRTIKLDIAADEHVETVQQATVFTGLWDDLPEPMAFDVYGIDEIGAEKLRCVIQRVQCRDPYDLYRLVDSLGLSLVDIRPLFERKTRAQGLDPAIFPRRFEERQAQYKKRWDDEMGAHLADPPTFNDTLRVLRRHLRAADLLD